MTKKISKDLPRENLIKYLKYNEGKNFKIKYKEESTVHINKIDFGIKSYETTVYLLSKLIKGVSNERVVIDKETGIKKELVNRGNQMMPVVVRRNYQIMKITRGQQKREKGLINTKTLEIQVV